MLTMTNLGMISPEGARSLNGSMIPTERDLARVFGYHPVMTGWVVGKKLLDGAQAQLLGALGDDERPWTTREKIGLALSVLTAASIVTIAVVTVMRR
jgi:hypothetical protein